jgi:hypothetical protein
MTNYIKNFIFENKQLSIIANGDLSTADYQKEFKEKILP